MAEFLGLGDVIALHHAVMGKLGAASQGLRDEGALESAIMRPRMAAHYEGADHVRQAALLAVGVSQAQAFVDGNKRTAYAALDTFLRLNGLVFSGDPIALARQLELVAERIDSLDDATDRLEEWLRQQVITIDTR